MFWTSVRLRGCSTRRRNTAAKFRSGFVVDCRGFDLAVVHRTLILSGTRHSYLPHQTRKG
jgi:hypothetical protein